MKKNAHADCQSRTHSPLSFRPNLGVCNSHHSPHPPPTKNWQNCRFVLFKKFVKSAQSQSLSSEICPENVSEIGFF